jgi:hypothetical protein
VVFNSTRLAVLFTYRHDAPFTSHRHLIALFWIDIFRYTWTVFFNITTLQLCREPASAAWVGQVSAMEAMMASIDIRNDAEMPNLCLRGI